MPDDNGPPSWDQVPIAVGLDPSDYLLGIRDGGEMVRFERGADEVAFDHMLCVLDRATLKAIDTTAITTAYLTTGLRAGVWVFRTGDQSAAVAADTLEGIYIKADAIASTAGAWVRADAQVVDPRWFGAQFNDTANDSAALAAADAMAVLLGRSLRLAYGTARLNSNVTLSAPLICQGGVVKPASGVTVTIAGPITAGQQKAFDSSLGGSVVFSNADVVHVDWWGAVSNGVTNDGPAILAAYNATPADGRLQLGSGDYYTTSTLVISKPITIAGMGMKATWISSEGVTAFSIAPSLNDVEISDMSIYNTGTPRAAGAYGVANQSTAFANGIGYTKIKRCWFALWDQAVCLKYHSFTEVFECRTLGNNIGYYSLYGINAKLRDSFYEVNNQWGMYIDGEAVSISESSGTLISGNEIVNNGSSGVGGNFFCQYNEHFSMVKNMIDVPAPGTPYNVHCFWVFRAEISNNWIAAGKVANVHLKFCSDMTVSNNNIVQAADRGLDVEGCATSSFTANIFTAQGGTDIYVHSTSLNNIFMANNMASTGSATSFEEVGACNTTAMGNRGDGNFILHASSVNLGNATY